MRTRAILSTIGMIGTLTAGAQYFVQMNGTVLNTGGNTVQVFFETVQGTMPHTTSNTYTDANDFYADTLNLSSSTGWVEVSYYNCDSLFHSMTEQYTASPISNYAQIYNVFNWCTSTYFDCLGVPNGSSTPGTPCNDNDPSTVNDAWSFGCTCVGIPTGSACQAIFAVQQDSITPWQMATVNTSMGQAPFTYSWLMPDGSTSTQFEPTFLFNSPGMHYLCLTITDNVGCASTHCDTLIVDPSGIINPTTAYYDCQGDLWGSAVAGTPCNDGNPQTTNDTWDATCTCIGTPVGGGCDAFFQYQQTTDPSGGAVPFSVTLTDSSSVSGSPINYSWTVNGAGNLVGNPLVYMANGAGPYFVCLTVSTFLCSDTYCDTLYFDANGILNGGGGGVVDCMGILNGPDLPGTPCDDGNPITTNDIWDANCNCVGTTANPCIPMFVVTQAYDSLTNQYVPNSLWAFVNYTGTPNTQVLWDFGDGTSSTSLFPSHTYATSGPYILCLTVSTALCTGTYCDTITVDSTGFIIPGQPGGQGFQLNIVDGSSSLDVFDNELVIEALKLFPNPTRDILNLEFKGFGQNDVVVRIMDLSGRTVTEKQHNSVHGSNRITISTDHLENGTYLLQLSVDGVSINERFVKNK